MVEVTLVAILTTAVVAYLILQFLRNLLIFLRNFPPSCNRNNLTDMEETDLIPQDEETGVEVEDITVSDSEDAPNPSDFKSIPLNIDYNSRIMSKEVSIEYHDGDDYNMHFNEHGGDFLSFKAKEKKHDTDTEDVDVSDEELPKFAKLNVQSVNVDAPASIAVKHSLDSVSTLNYSSSFISQEDGTDAEYISDDEMNDNPERGILNEGQHRTLSSGLAVAGTVSAKTSSVPLITRQNILKNLKSTGLSPNLFSGSKDFNELWEEQDAPLMTCLEFLKAEISEDGGTDVEDLSVGEDGKEKLCNVQNIVDLNKMSGKQKSSSNADGTDSSLPLNTRSSEDLTEDEMVSFENEDSESLKKRSRKRRMKQLYDKDKNTNESLTDEEFVNLEHEEWTETDESGGMRQITQIKTETSIKLEGDGDSVMREGDDFSRTTTTTTSK